MEFDYLVIGAGSAGCVIASRLSEDPATRVCLVEAGGPDGSALIRAPLGFVAEAKLRKNSVHYATVPQPGLHGRQGFQPRGRVLGGSSAVNAMIYCRGHRSDYDHWAALGNPGWDYDSVLPLFKKAEDSACFGANDHHGSGGPLGVDWLRSRFATTPAFLRACAAQGIAPTPDYNGARQEGASPAQVTQRGGERCSAARAYLAPHVQRPNLQVLTRTQTLAITWAGRRAVGVRVVQGGQERLLRARREIILAGGAYGSPQLLLCSGIGPAAQLARHGIAVLHALPGVGQNLQDHITASLNWHSPHSAAGFGVCPSGAVQLLRGIREWQAQRSGPITSNVAEAVAFLRTAPDLPASDIQLTFVAAMVDDHSRKLHFGHGFGLHVTLTHPESRGEVRLASSDARDSLLIDPRYFSAPDDLPRLVRGVQKGLAVMHDPALAPWRGAMVRPLAQDDPEAIAEEMRRHADTEYHPVGTCRMGPHSDPLAVVGPDLRVHGIDGLRVADASIMPTLTTGNTNAPSIMIGEKCAELLRQAA